MAALSNTMLILRDANQIKITDAAQVAAVFRDLLALEDAIARDTEHYFVMHLDVRHTVKLVESRSGERVPTDWHMGEAMRE